MSGGDCARTLVESSAGGYEPPFPVNGAKRRLRLNTEASGEREEHEELCDVL